MLLKWLKKSEHNLFFKACEHGDETQVTLMLKRTPSLATEVNKNGASGLMLSALSGNVRTVNHILSVSTLHVNTQEPSNAASPLSLAVLNGNIAIVHSLLESGANPNLENHRGITPLHIAVDNEHAEIALLLIQHGADIFKMDGYQNTPWGMMKHSKDKRLIDFYELVLSKLNESEDATKYST